MVQAINDSGEILGYGLNKEYLAEGRAILWRGTSHPTLIEPPKGWVLIPIALNNRGEVVGFSRADYSLPSSGARAFLWSQKSGFVDLHSKLACRSSQATSINRHGWVVGSLRGDDGIFQPFLLQGDKVVTLIAKEMAKVGAVARDVNDSGHVLINSFPGSGVYVWSSDVGLVHLPDPPGCKKAFGIGIDSTGRVLLGAKSGDRDQYFLHVRGECIALPKVSADKDATYWDLGAGGWLVGTINERSADGDLIYRGFLLRLYR